MRTNSIFIAHAAEAIRRDLALTGHADPRPTHKGDAKLHRLAPEQLGLLAATDRCHEECIAETDPAVLTGPAI